MPQLLVKPLSWFKINPQVRKTFEEDDLRRLGESLRKKQLQPLLAQPDGDVIVGERRYRAANLVGLETLEVKIADEQLSDHQVKVWQLVENMARQDLSAFEKWTGCCELMCANPTWNQKLLAENLHESESMVVRLLSPSRCIPPWQDALKAGKVGISDCYQASQLPETDQAELLRLKLNGASRDEVARIGRQKRNGTAPAVKVARVKCLLPSGVCIVASGEGLSLDDLIESLGEAQKEARKARDQGLDAKTFQAVLKDKAKKGQ